MDKRWKQTIVGVAVVSLVTVVAIPVIGGLAFSFEWGYDETERVASPDGRFDAILLRGDAGAVSGYQYELYVLPHGRIVDRERDGRHRVFDGTENGGRPQYVWHGRDLSVLMPESPIDGYWPYYFSEDSSGRREVGGRVLLAVQREQ